jgi:hexosaminidase
LRLLSRTVESPNGNDNCLQEYVLAGGNMSTLLEEFVITTHPYITGSNKTAVYWEDLLTDRDINVPSTALPKETTILQTWNNGAANTKLLTSNGYRTIVSSSDFYYLDCGHGGWVGNDSRYVALQLSL